MSGGPGGVTAQLESLAGFSAVIDRLGEFDEVVQAPEAARAKLAAAGGSPAARTGGGGRGAGAGCERWRGQAIMAWRMSSPQLAPYTRTVVMRLLARAADGVQHRPHTAENFQGS